MIRDVHPGSGFRIWILFFFTHSGSRVQGSKRHRIPHLDPQHCINVIIFKHNINIIRWQVIAIEISSLLFHSREGQLLPSEWWIWVAVRNFSTPIQHVLDDWYLLQSFKARLIGLNSTIANCVWLIDLSFQSCKASLIRFVQYYCKMRSIIDQF